MRMPKQNLEIINCIIWFSVLLLAVIPDIASEALYDLTGYISAPFDLCIFPGLFYYFKYKEPSETQN